MKLKNENWKRAYNKLAEEFFALQEDYARLVYQNDKELLDDTVDPWSGCACGNSSTCGTTFTSARETFVVTPEGVIDRPNLTEGRYTVLIKREKDVI